MALNHPSIYLIFGMALSFVLAAIWRRWSLLRETLGVFLNFDASFYQKIRVMIRFVRLCWSDTKVGAMMNVPADVRGAWSQLKSAPEYDPDKFTDDLKNPVMNPMIAFHEAIRCEDTSKLPADNPFKGRKVSVEEAFVFEARFDERGKIVRDPKVLESIGHQWPEPYRIRQVRGSDRFKSILESNRSDWEKQPSRSKAARECAHARLMAARHLKEDGFGNDFLANGSLFSPQFDPNQYTEFVPLMGGPYFKQLYLYDYLKMSSYAFEAKNHNPYAKRGLDIMTQYALGRRFKVRIKDERKEKAWKAFDAEHKFKENLCTSWATQANCDGEFMLNTRTWRPIDPSTVWDIVTDIDDVNDAYYYYQSYPAAYQMYTGYRVAGEPGSENQPASAYFVRQIPANEVLHLKFNCAPNEKRGRSLLFPILGWLKRIKDLYNAQVIRQWLLSCFVWDVTIKGSQTDASAYAAQYSQMPTPGSVEVHNESVTREPMPAISAAGRNQSDVGSELLSLIATSFGMPKEFLNVITQGGGARATALTGAEPFTKVIEEMQARWEFFLTEVFKIVMQQAGLDYQDGDVEFIFPSVAKDTTTETLKNLQLCQEMKWFDPQTCAEMAAAEMNITGYDYDKATARIQELERKGWLLPYPPPPGFGTQPMDADAMANGAPPSPDGSVNDSESPIHGNGKVDLKKQLNRI